MVIPFSPFFVFMVFAETVLAFSRSDLLPISTCSRSPFELRVGTASQCKPSVFELLETKLNVEYNAVAQECDAAIQNEKVNHSNHKSIGGLGWIRAIWTMVDLLLGQFVLTPVSGGSVTWARTIPTGTLKSSSSICSSMTKFAESLRGFKTKTVAISAGSTSIICNNAAIAKQITDHFSLTSPSKTTFSCNSNSWSVGICGNGREITAAVGQSTICSCNAAANTVTIRPCINNVNWGGIGKKVCSSTKTTLRITVSSQTFFVLPTPIPTAQPTLSPTAMPTQTPTAQPTWSPTATPTFSPSTVPTMSPTATPTFSPSTAPTTSPTARPTFSPSTAPTTSPTATPTLSPSTVPTTSPTLNPTTQVDLISDFDIIDKNGDGFLNYDEIAFAIADTNKDDKLSLKEYEAARSDRIFIDTAYTSTNSSLVKFSGVVDFITGDFDIIDRNGDGFLNYDEIAFAIADIKKDGKLTLKEYEAARARRILVDTSFKLD